MITEILISEVQNYYPVTDSLTQKKINDLTKFVKNNIFLQMFGLAITNEIFEGSIPNNQSDNFIGFREFIALCIASQLIEDSFIHTNAGLKYINQSNWQTPRVNEKTNPLNKLSGTIENQFQEAKKILIDLEKIPSNQYQSYASFKIHKI